MNPCATTLRRALARSDTWMSRAALCGAAARAGFSDELVADELADLIAAGDVLYNDRASGYRLAGSPIARRALRELLQLGVERHVVAQPMKDQPLLRMGVAVRRQHDDGTEHLVMAELQMPFDATDLQARAQLVAGWCRFDAALAKAATPTARPATP